MFQIELNRIPCPCVHVLVYSRALGRCALWTVASSHAVSLRLTEVSLVPIMCVCLYHGSNLGLTRSHLVCVCLYHDSRVFIRVGSAVVLFGPLRPLMQSHCVSPGLQVAVLL